MILAGVYKSAGESLKELWSEEDGREIFRATMSLQRFEIIRQFLRFDNKESRANRRRLDKLAPIRSLFDMFLQQLPKMFIPYENVTIDEQLVPFRGKCPFRQYLPSKPRGKYGIKLWLMSDVKTAYVCAAETYTGKSSDGQREINQGRNVVLRLAKSIEGTGRNITVDNFFTDYILAKELLKKKLTIVGTVRKNKPFIPPEFRESRERETFSSSFGFEHDMTLVSYVPKKNKSVTLLSTMHHEAKVSEDKERKPEIILYYNQTKGGVDTTDKLAATYSCKRGTRRWPVCLFYNMIDLAAINAFVLFMHVNSSYHQKKLFKRRIFLKELGKMLTEPHRNARMKKNIPITIKKKLLVVAGDSSKNISSPKRGRCKECGPKRDRKTLTRCAVCQGFLCQEHVNVYCKSCLE